MQLNSSLVRFFILLVTGLLACSCFAPPSRAQKLSESAFEFNNAAKFGRLDVALGVIRPAFQREFAKKHAGWGRNVRIIEVELAGLELLENERANLVIDVAWQPMNDAILRSTRISQKWVDERGTWSLESEAYAGGDLGLYGEESNASVVKDSNSFQTTVIRSNSQ